MPRSTRGKKGFRLVRRLLSPVQQGVGLLGNVGRAALQGSRKIFNAGVGFARKTVGSAGKRTSAAFKGMIGRKKTRRNRQSRSQRR